MSESLHDKIFYGKYAKEAQQFSHLARIKDYYKDAEFTPESFNIFLKQIKDFSIYKVELKKDIEHFIKQFDNMPHENCQSIFFACG